MAGYDLNPHSGMISLDLPPGTIKPPPGGVDDHHVTVVYLGPDVDDKAMATAVQRAQDAAAKVGGPLVGTVGGLATFPPSDGSDGKTVAYAPAQIPGAEKLRDALGDLSASEHKVFKPHVTLSYLGKDDPMPDPVPPVPVRFDHLTVHRGDEAVHVPLDPQAQRGSVAYDSTHIKIGKTNEGLWHHKNMQLPAYIQHVARQLEMAGHSESEAAHMAVGVVKNWAAGHDGHGHQVHPETQAKATAALADWEKLRAQAHATSTAKRSSTMATPGPAPTPQAPEPPDFQPDESWASDMSLCPDLSGLNVPDLEDAEASLGWMV